MKTSKLFLIIIFLLAVPVLLADNVEECWGTWINKDYNEDNAKRAKLILNRGGTFVLYNKESDVPPDYSGTVTIEAKWIDSNGNAWYKIILYDNTLDYYWYLLCKLSNSGTILEAVRSYVGDFATEIDPKDYNYLVWYRQ